MKRGKEILIYTPYCKSTK